MDICNERNNIAVGFKSSLKCTHAMLYFHLKGY